MTIQEIEQANKAAGQLWFSSGAVRYFASGIDLEVYEGPGGVFFVSSEKALREPRAYTVRQFHPDTGRVSTVGEFNVWTRKGAHQQAKQAAAKTRR